MKQIELDRNEVLKKDQEVEKQCKTIQNELSEVDTGSTDIIVEVLRSTKIEPMIMQDKNENVNRRKKEILKEKDKNSMEYVKLLEEANSLRDKKDELMKKDLELQQENVKLEPDINKFDPHNRKVLDINHSSENKRLELRQQINELSKEIQ